MKKELQDKLIKEFPQLFQDVKKSPMETCMCWGCECGDGWYDLLHDLCQKIMETNPPEDFKFAQVKEKFGGLRVYVFGDTEEISKLIDEAERRSITICETCGSTENVRSDWIAGWVNTICKSCAPKHFGKDVEKLWDSGEPSGE